MTEILHDDEAGIAAAARLLRDGALVAFGTETVYGLGADATNAAAVAGIFAAKGRPRFNPLICHYESADTALCDPARRGWRESLLVQCRPRQSPQCDMFSCHFPKTYVNMYRRLSSLRLALDIARCRPRLCSPGFSRLDSLLYIYCGSPIS